ncbi:MULTISPECIES: monofunctional biosynthetic peptidoglycan transglycosylase [Hyphomicrobiales]|jgi:monofunctional glycosyltransferase|uniref:monofunctional biosynthetic peptidoglycan transglycosylase n=1 Tax=Hyphomicrobiales TaxID=356 RepID=UPI003299140E
MIATVKQDLKPEGPGGDRLGEGEAGDKPGLVARVARIVAQVLILLFIGPAIAILFYAVVPPPATPLMLIRLSEGHGISKTWQPLARISPNLQRAVIASEDAKFCAHGGFDWEAVDTAFERYREGGYLLGASTISMQTSKNLFLWPGRTFIRKGGEAYITVWLEALLSKKRILELYLNVIEFGPGIYGAEAAAQHYYGVSAARLTQTQAAELASILPNPLQWRPGTRGRAGTISARMNSVRLGINGPCE